jgi:hypothetical protein
VCNVAIPDLFQSLEIVAVDITCCGIISRLILVYRPPNYDSDQNTLLASALRHLSSKITRLAIIGDFNLPSVDWKCVNNSVMLNCHELIDFFTDSGLYQVVDQPTRDKNILDLVFVNDPILVISLEIIPPVSTSDHNCVHFQFSINNMNSVHVPKLSSVT